MKNARSFLAGVGATLLTLSLAGSALAGYQKQATLDYTGIQITLDGQTVTPTDAAGSPVEPFAIDGATYLPVRGIASTLGLGVDWDQATQTVKLTSGGQAAAPAQPAAPSGTYSRTNPAPVGTAQSIHVKNYTQDYTASMLVLETTRGDAAWQAILAANMFNTAPEAGKEYILIKVRLSVDNSAEDKAVSVSNYDFTAYTSDHVEYPKVSTVLPDPALHGNVFAGGTLEGYVSFLVNTSDASPKMVYGDNYDGTGGIWFSLT